METQTEPRFRSIEDVKQANERAGLYFFEPATMRFFNSRIGQQLFGGRYFVTSERREMTWDCPRRYTIREALPTGDINTVGEFQEWASAAAAQARIRSLLASR